MGRQSGDLLLGMALLVGVFSLGLSGRMTAHTPAACNSEPGGHDKEHRESSAGAWLRGNDKAFACLPSPAPVVSHQPSRAVLKNLPRGARVVIASLDVSGERHVVTLTKSTFAGDSGESIVPMRVTSRESDRRERCVATGEMLPASAFDSSDSSLPRDPDAKALAGTSIEALQTEAQHHRVFLLPHFQDAGVIQEPAACELINENASIRAYFDPRLKNSQHVEQLRIQCERLISAAESDALPIAETWVGKISDVDHDQKLSLVITNLDDRSIQSKGVAPVHGCIREIDFQFDSVLGGDIVYLDAAILNLPHREQTPLLTHELAHAAVCSIPLERQRIMLNDRIAPRSSIPFAKSGGDSSANMLEASAAQITASSATDRIPSWLNEAVAHLMELQCVGTFDSSAASSGNFQRRIDDFYANSACSPIVAAEHVMSLEERRSGSRGAATLFLKPWLTSPELMQRFLHSDASLDRRMEVLTDKSFADIFREWTLSMAAGAVENQPLRVDAVPAGGIVEQFSVLGTAFKCFKCSESIPVIVIESHVDAKLQISIIEPDTRMTFVQPVTQQRYASTAKLDLQ